MSLLVTALVVASVQIVVTLLALIALSNNLGLDLYYCSVIYHDDAHISSHVHIPAEDTDVKAAASAGPRTSPGTSLPHEFDANNRDSHAVRQPNPGNYISRNAAHSPATAT